MGHIQWFNVLKHVLDAQAKCSCVKMIIFVSFSHMQFVVVGIFCFPVMFWHVWPFLICRQERWLLWSRNWGLRVEGTTKSLQWTAFARMHSWNLWGWRQKFCWKVMNFWGLLMMRWILFPWRMWIENGMRSCLNTLSLNSCNWQFFECCWCAEWWLDHFC